MKPRETGSSIIKLKSLFVCWFGLKAVSSGTTGSNLKNLFCVG